MMCAHPTGEFCNVCFGRPEALQLVPIEGSHDDCQNLLAFYRDANALIDACGEVNQANAMRKIRALEQRVRELEETVARLLA